MKNKDMQEQIDNKTRRLLAYCERNVQIPPVPDEITGEMEQKKWAQKQRKLRTMCMLIGVFSPYLKDFALESPFNQNFFIKIQQELIDLLQRPGTHLHDHSFFGAIKQKDAHNMVRKSLVNYLEENMDYFFSWNQVYPDAPIDVNDIPLLKQQIRHTQELVDMRYELGIVHSALLDKEKRSRVVIGLGATAVASLAVAAGAGSITASILTGGIAAIALVAVAAVAFMWYRHKQRKTNTAIKEYLDTKCSHQDINKYNSEELKEISMELDEMALGRKYSPAESQSLRLIGADKQGDVLNDIMPTTPRVNILTR